MSPTMGLVLIRCPSCNQQHFVLVRDLMVSEAVACRVCLGVQSSEVAVASNPPLAKLVEIMRQLEGFRAAKLDRDEVRLIEASKRSREQAATTEVSLLEEGAQACPEDAGEQTRMQKYG